MIHFDMDIPGIDLQSFSADAIPLCLQPEEASASPAQVVLFTSMMQETMATTDKFLSSMAHTPTRNLEHLISSATSQPAIVIPQQAATATQKPLATAVEQIPAQQPRPAITVAEPQVFAPYVVVSNIAMLQQAMATPQQVVVATPQQTPMAMPTIKIVVDPDLHPAALRL